MNRFTTAATLVAAVMLTGTAVADPGPTPAGTAIAEYDPTTGEIVVSVGGVVNWHVESFSSSLNGDSPQPPLPVGGGLVSDTDQIIGEIGFISVSFTDLNLGNVAATGLPLGDLPHQTLTTLGETNHRGGGPIALGIGDDLGLTTFHHGHHTIGGAQINTNYLAHLGISFLL